MTFNTTGRLRGAKDLAPLREELSRRAPGTRLVETGYLAGTELFAEE